MTLDEVRAVIVAATSIDPAAALMLRVAAVTGARRAELAALRWTDLSGDVLTIDSAIGFVTSGDGHREFTDAATKTSNVRTVTLDPDTVVAIEVLRREREPYGPWMFGLGPELVSPDRIGWWWKRARKLAGIDERWRLHDLRHWSATVAIGQGHDVRTVAGRLGHANPAMTLRVYAQAFAAADQAVAVALGEALDRVPDEPVQDERDVGQSSGMEVLARLGTDQQALADFCRRNGIRRLAVFGSALRDDFTPESDVDLLVEFEPGEVPGMLRISGMELELEEKVFHGRRVDLGPPQSSVSASATGLSPRPRRSMTQPRDDERIAHMVEACEEGMAFVVGRARADLDDDRVLQLALCKLIENVGEAAKAVTPEFRAKYPGVEWSSAARMRDSPTPSHSSPTTVAETSTPTSSENSASRPALGRRCWHRAADQQARHSYPRTSRPRNDLSRRMVKAGPADPLRRTKSARAVPRVPSNQPESCHRSEPVTRRQLQRRGIVEQRSVPPTSEPPTPAVQRQRIACRHTARARLHAITPNRGEA